MSESKLPKSIEFNSLDISAVPVVPVVAGVSTLGALTLLLPVLFVCGIETARIIITAIATTANIIHNTFFEFLFSMFLII